MTTPRLASEYTVEYKRLVDICGGDAFGRPRRAFRMRAHKLLAQEMVAYIATTDREHSGSQPYEMHLRVANASGGTDSADWFAMFGNRVPLSYPGMGTVQRSPDPGAVAAYMSALAQMRTGLAQLELDIAAAGEWP